ncbi:hypothetical protein H5410_021956 [Solanum commersonii]|uniref:Uncharacterized protein n=1 Tax=Solanum commersonii TaxID=4109 RepID=A0A9J5ZCI8_SOLCO|nr:hypothetical protein H5410_021956 [Solanum commersonii]
MSEQVKKDRCSLKGGSLHTGGAKTVGTITREMVFKMTHVKKKENESNSDVWVEERTEQTFDTDDDSDEDDDFVDRTP